MAESNRFLHALRSRLFPTAADRAASSERHAVGSPEAPDTGSIALSTEVTVVRCTNGRDMLVLPDDQRSQKLLASQGDANPPSLAAWKELVGSRRWDLIVDIGANYGEMLLNVDLGGHGRIVAVEPNQNVFACLVESIARNGLPVTAVCAALGSHPGVVELDVSDPSSGVASVHPVAADSVGMILTPLCRLDDLVGSLGLEVRESAVLLKIDVEGYEREVLTGASQLLASAADVAIMSEVLHDPFMPDGFEVTQEIRSETMPELVQDVVFRRRR